jgi:coenzyme F420-0:L-glutamate ligase/coenzyme F420-1:gamma-L-glutamate ligase
MTLEVLPVTGLPEIGPGDDLAGLLADALPDPSDADCVVVTQKLVSKSENRLVEVDPNDPTSHKPVVERESVRILRRRGDLIISETSHGFVCANAGVDQSSSGAEGRVLVLPADPDASARRVRHRCAELGVDVAVIVSDTFGRPWREGQTDVAIGVAGIEPLLSYIGETDPHGHEFRVQELCVADELAAAAELVKGNTSRMPVGVIRGYPWESVDGATMAPVLRDPERDLFR